MLDLDLAVSWYSVKLFQICGGRSSIVSSLFPGPCFFLFSGYVILIQ